MVHHGDSDVGDSVDDLLCDVVAGTLNGWTEGQPKQLFVTSPAPSPAIFSGSELRAPRDHDSNRRQRRIQQQIIDLMSVDSFSGAQLDQLQSASSYTQMDFATFTAQDASDKITNAGARVETFGGCPARIHRIQPQEIGPTLHHHQPPPAAPRCGESRALTAAALSSAVPRTSKGREILSPRWNDTYIVPSDRRALLAGPACVLPSAEEVMTLLATMERAQDEAIPVW